MAKRTYYLCYNYHFQTVWFRVAKVGSRTIHQHFLEHTPDNQYIYSSEVGYVPSLLKGFFKFAFVRNPLDRFVSAWKDKVLRQNYFQFSPAAWKHYQELSAFIEWVEQQDLTACDEHLRTQTSLIDLNQVDFLGRFESFEADYHRLATTIGLPIQWQHHKNATPKTPVKLTTEQEARLRTLYAHDLQILYPHLR